MQNEKPKQINSEMTIADILIHIPIYITTLIIAAIVLIFALLRHVFKKISSLLSDLSNLVNSSDNKPLNGYGHKCPIDLRYWPHGYNYMFMDIYDRFLDSFEGGDERLRVYWSKEKPKCIKSEIKSHWEFEGQPTIISGAVFPLDTFNGAPIHELIWKRMQHEL